MKKIFALILVFQSMFARADVIVRSPDTDEISYLKAVSGKGKTVIDHLNSQLPVAADQKRLVQKFEKAQGLFLSSDLVAAKVAFIEVSEEALRADWTEAQRKAILISLLRVAQLSSDVHASQNYLVRAAQFAPDIEVDLTLFPPPLTAQYREVLTQEKAKSVQVDLSEKFPQHQLVIFDGKRIRPEEMRAFTVMTGRHRVTALSNSHQAFTQELSSSQLSLIRADVPAYAIGTCEEPALSGYQSLESERVQIIFPNCTRTYTGTSWINSAEADKLPSSFTRLPTASNAMRTSAQPVLNKKKLIIIGVATAALVTAAIIVKNSQRKEEVEPVSRQGF